MSEIDKTSELADVGRSGRKIRTGQDVLEGGLDIGSVQSRRLDEGQVVLGCIYNPARHQHRGYLARPVVATITH